MEKRINFFWTAGFFLPAINATVFTKDISKVSNNHILKKFIRERRRFCFYQGQKLGKKNSIQFLKDTLSMLPELFFQIEFNAIQKTAKFPS
jgi:hypothetical protein